MKIVSKRVDRARSLRENTENIENMYIAKQCPPSEQEPPFDFPDDFWAVSGIIIDGGSRYTSYTNYLYDMIVDNANDVEDCIRTFLDSDENDVSVYDSVEDIIMDFYPPNHKSIYSSQEIEQFKDIFLNIKYNFADGDLAKLLTLISGDKYLSGVMRGNSQGEQVDVFYPEDEKDFIRTLESYYFNTGTEWYVLDENGDFDFSVYCIGYDNEDIRTQIADSIGTSPHNVMMLAFDKYKQTPIYKEV